MKFILTLIVVYLALRLIARIVFPILLKMFAQNMSEQMNNSQRNNQQQSSHKKEGETLLQKNTTLPTSNFDNQGDYVDFEELK